MRKLFLVVLAFICCLFLSYEEASAQKVLTIGSIRNTTGPAAHLGKTALNGTTIAMEEINAKGGITVGKEKYKLAFINYDDKCSAKDAVAIAERLVHQDKVPLILGTICSHATLAAMEITEKNKVPLLNAISASPKITQSGGKYIFRTGATAAIQMETITRYAAEELKVKTAAFVGRNDAWTQAAAFEYKRRFEKRGIKVLVSELYELGTTDFYSILSKVKMANPDCVYFNALAEDGGMLVKQAREVGIKAQLLGNDSTANQTFFGIAGAASDGMYVFWNGGPSSKAMTDYEERYKKRFGVESIAPDVMAYDAVYIAAKAFERAGSVTDTQKIRDALSKTDYKGIRQRFTFDENGQGKCEMWIGKNENQKVKVFKQIFIYDNPPYPL